MNEIRNVMLTNQTRHQIYFPKQIEIGVKRIPHQSIGQVPTYNRGILVKKVCKTILQKLTTLIGHSVGTRDRRFKQLTSQNLHVFVYISRRHRGIYQTVLPSRNFVR